MSISGVNLFTPPKTTSLVVSPERGGFAPPLQFVVVVHFAFPVVPAAQVYVVALPLIGMSTLMAAKATTKCVGLWRKRQQSGVGINDNRRINEKLSLLLALTRVTLAQQRDRAIQ